MSVIKVVEARDEGPVMEMVVEADKDEEEELEGGQAEGMEDAVMQMARIQ